MPGPPEGPSLRMTTTSPSLIPWAVTAAMASSSFSNTRAGPVCSMRSWPESFTTQPSGARLPRRIARPPCGFSALSIGRTTSWPASSTTSSASSPIVRPVTVTGSRWPMPESKRRFITSGTPPARNRSGATKRPPGLRSPISGVMELIRSKSSMSSSTPASLATARRWRTTFVDPPVEVADAMAFSSDSLLMIALGFRSFSMRSMIRRPQCDGHLSLFAVLGRHHRAAHRRDAERLECHGHRVRGELAAAGSGAGRGDALELVQLLVVMSPAAWAPTASNTSWIVTSLPFSRPGAIEPP